MPVWQLCISKPSWRHRRLHIVAHDDRNCSTVHCSTLLQCSLAKYRMRSWCSVARCDVLVWQNLEWERNVERWKKCSVEHDRDYSNVIHQLSAGRGGSAARGNAHHQPWEQLSSSCPFHLATIIGELLESQANFFGVHLSRHVISKEAPNKV